MVFNPPPLTISTLKQLGIIDTPEHLIMFNKIYESLEGYLSIYRKGKKPRFANFKVRIADLAKLVPCHKQTLIEYLDCTKVRKLFNKYGLVLADLHYVRNSHKRPVWLIHKDYES